MSSTIREKSEFTKKHFAIRTCYQSFLKRKFECNFQLFFRELASWYPFLIPEFRSQRAIKPTAHPLVALLTKCWPQNQHNLWKISDQQKKKKNQFFEQRILCNFPMVFFINFCLLKNEKLGWRKMYQYCLKLNENPQ